MNLLNLFESNDSGFQALDAWKQQVLQAHPDHAGKIKFLGRDNQVSAEIPGRDRSFGVFDLDTEQGQVLDEAHNNYHANRTGFAKPQRDLSGEGEPEGMFAVVIDGRTWKEFTSNKAFAVAKTIATKYPNKTVQVKWPTGQLNTVKEEWSQKYKSSINCSHPKGFSQKAHCAGKKKHNESVDQEMVCEDCGMCETHGDHMMEVKQRLDAKCWTGKKIGNPKTKIKGGVRVNNCVPAESVEEGFDSAYSPSTSSTNSTPELRGIHIPGNIKHPDWREPAWSFQEIAEKLGVTSNELRTLVLHIGNFPKKLEGVTSNNGSRTYYPRSEIKRWVNATNIRNIIKSKQGVAEGKITLSTDPNWYGATVDNYQATGPVVNIPANQLVGFEPDDKMNQPKSKVNVEKIVAGLKQGAKLPPLLVRKYKNGYQVLDGHHRFWAYKLVGVKSIPAQIVPDSDIEEISKQGVAEGWKERLGAAALAGSMALGANARVTPDGQGGFTGGIKPSATVTAPDTAPSKAEAPQGFSKEYLQKAADPNRTGRYMISVVRAQELLNGMKEGVAEGVAETIPWKEAQTVLNHYGADYFGTSYDKLYFYKYRKRFSIGLIRGKDGNHSVNLSELNAMVRKLRGMRVPLSPFEEGELNEFVTPQATAQDPGLEREKDVDVIIFGRMPQDFTYNLLIEALEAVLPREYPPGSSQNTQGVPSSPAERIGGKIAKNGGAVVTTKPLSTAQKLVKEFQARGIKCRIDAPGLEEGSKELPQWKKDWYAKQKPNSWPKHPQPYHDPDWIAKLPPEELKKLTGKKGMSEGDDPWGDQGNFAGDKPVNIGGATVKPIQVGDTVTYLGQRAKILAQSKDRKHSRITIEKGMGSVTQDVLTSDLKRTGLKEFSPPGGNNGDSGRWYTDDELADIIGDDWFEDFDVSHDEFNIDTHGEKAKQNLAGYANSWFDDKGYNVNVMGVDHNDVDHDLKWYIVGSFQNDNFAKKDVDEGTDNVVHRIGLTVTDPNHPMVSKRGETIQKTVRVTGGNQEQAINRAIAHHRKKGYKVHDHHYIGTANSPAVKEEGPGPGAETGFGAEGSKKLGTVNTELISRAWKENRPNVVLTFGKSGEYRLDRGMIRYLLGYYKALPDDNSKWYFIYETMSRLEKLVALLEKANLPNSGIPTPGQQELDLTEKKRPNDDLSSAGARDADVQRALQKARAATPTASSDIGALVKQDLQTQEKTQQKLADIEADNQRQMDMLKKADSVNNDQQRAIRSLERQISKVPGATAPAKIEPTPAPKKSAVTPVAPAVEPARMPPMARPRPTIGNKVPADVSIPSISTPSISLPDPSTAVQSPSTAVQSPTMLQIPQGQQTILPSMTPQPASQYNTADAVDVDFRHLGAAPNLDNFDEPEEPQKRTGTYGEGIQETANDMVKFSIDGERAYDAVMDRFGHVIDWSDDSMTAPRNIWSRIEEIAHDFGGEASEEGSEFALGE